MKVDQRFHCFGCGEDGDVIDFTAKLFDLSPKEAAEKLAQDFGLIYDSQAPAPQEICPAKNRGTEVSGGSTALLPRTVRLLLSAEKNGKPTVLPGHRRKNRTPALWKQSRRKPYVEYLLDLFSL